MSTAKKAAVAAAAALAALAVAAAVITAPKADMAMELVTVDGMEDAEVRELVSGDGFPRAAVEARPVLEDGELTLELAVGEDCGYALAVTIEQGDEVVYDSGTLAPGEGITACAAPDAEPGRATVTIQPIDPETGELAGDPSTASITIASEE